VVPAGVPGGLTVEQMWNLARVGSPSLSPDGRMAVVAVTRFDMETDKGSADLWLVPTDGGPARQLTTSPASDSEPTFSPDGRLIAFVSRRNEDARAQLWVIPVDGGEARRVTDVPTGVSAPRWFPDSRRIAFLSSVWTDLDTWDAQKARLEQRAKSEMTARVWDRAPFSYWDRFIDDRETHIFVVDTTTTQVASVTRGSGQSVDFREPSVDSYDISPDGLEIAFAGDSSRVGNASNYDVFTVPVAGGAARNLTADNPADDGNPLYSPDGRTLAFVQQRIVGFYADKARVILVDRATNARRELAQQWDRSASDLVWAPDSRALFGAIDDAATRRIHRIPVDGSMPVPVTRANDFAAVDVVAAPGQRRGRTELVMVALRQSFSEPPTLVRVDPRNGTPTQLSRFNDDALRTVQMGRVESVTYTGSNGAPIQMWVVYPPNFDPSKRHPLFLLLHGGPHNAVTDSWTFRWNAQVFAAWGYVVAWHNFHGSSGFGQDFTDSINPDRITKPYQDTIAAAEWFKAQPWIDPTRMAAGGGSYGGFLASALLGRDHPFQALVAHAAVYNSFTQIGADYAAQPERHFEFWENPTDFARFSPHTNAGNFRTPTLVIHGQNDMRVPVNHGFELFNILQRQGVPSRLVYYPDENHWILQPQNSVFWYAQVREWIGRYAPPGLR
jgi:dipeptidyl aminopeptidase/acylaminoacyl peptidase